MAFLSRLEEISIKKQIRNKLEKCTYKQLYSIATYNPKTHELPESPLSFINIFKSGFQRGSSGGEAAKEYKAQPIRNLARNLAREVIVEKYPNLKQPTQLKDYL